MQNFVAVQSAFENGNQAHLSRAVHEGVVNLLSSAQPTPSHIPTTIESLLQTYPSTLSNILNSFAHHLSINPLSQDLISSILTHLVFSRPEHRAPIRHFLISKNLLIHVVLHISLIQGDTVDVLHSLLSTESTYFSNESSNTALMEQLGVTKSAVFERVQGLSKSPLPTQCILMRLISAFTGYFKLQLTPEESHACLNYILAPSSSTNSFESIRLTRLKLSTLIVAADQFFSVSVEKFTQALMKVTQSDTSEFTLMLGVFCHTNQLAEVRDLVRGVLNVQVVVSPDGLQRLRSIFTEKLLTETDIAHRSLALRKHATSSTLSSGLEIVVVHELLKAKIYQKAGIDVKEWIMQAIRTLKPPYHSQFPELLKIYVETLIESQTFTRISDLEVTASFERGAAIQPYHVVLLFQVLYLNDRYFAKRIAPNTTEINPTCSEYPESVMNILPINRILTYMERAENREGLGAFYPSIASLVASQYPQIVAAASFLQSENHLDEEALIPLDYRIRILYDQLKPSLRGGATDLFSFRVTEATVIPVLKACNQEPGAAIACLEYLCALESSQLLMYLDVVVDHFFPAVLSSTNDRIRSLFQKLFQCLNSISPREVWIKTIKAWLPKGILTNQDVLQNPLIIFRVDERVFKIPEVFAVFLQILDCYLTSSRHYYFHTYQMNIFTDKTSKIKEAHLYALLELQESAALQALLEVCETGEMLSDDATRINSTACAFIHQRFVLAKKSMKLMHFQGYRDDLIPVAVDKIPSMHVCFEFLAELLQQASLEKQVFAVILASHLCVKYPIPASHQLIVSTVLPKMIAMCSQISESTVVAPTGSTPQEQQQRQIAATQASLLKVFICFGRIVQAFPFLIEKIDPFINTMSQTRPANIEFIKVVAQVKGMIQEVMRNPSQVNKSTQRIK
ncbi:Integrator complex subunit 2 [Rhizoclosmatium sp. JEL0117]|nr:Integrator complex subunit 2 [Rhizoclosmatium sp. JEL0117]